MGDVCCVVLTLVVLFYNIMAFRNMRYIHVCGLFILTGWWTAPVQLSHTQSYVMLELNNL